MSKIIGLTSVTHPAANAKARRLAILLHGYGSDANDLIGLAPAFAAQLPDTAFVSANAPFPCEAGFGHQWFSLQSWDEIALKRGVLEALPSLQAFIAAQCACFGVSRGDAALIGFSQGTIMALAAGLGEAPAVAGVLGYSGALVEATPITAKPPVLLVHGDADQVLPHAATLAAIEQLKACEVSAESLIRPGLAHAIDPQGIAAGIGFLRRIWPR
jgi:phospholipase/carboxylesterase